MFKYALQPGSKKTHCPKCGKKRFVPYINNQTKEILHHTVGRCDREVNEHISNINPTNMRLRFLFASDSERSAGIAFCDSRKEHAGMRENSAQQSPRTGWIVFFDSFL